MKKSVSTVLKENTMIIVLVLVFLFFTWQTNGAMFSPSKFEQLIKEYAYVYILASGMLMCMLTGGNIDLSCGSFVCFLGAVGAYFMKTVGMNTALAIFLMLVIGIVYGCILGFLIAYVNIPPWIATLAGYLAFRGLGTAVLGAADPVKKSINVNSVTGFMKLFSGKIAGTKISEFNIPCMTVGAIAAALVIFVNMYGRAQKVRKGYETDSLLSVMIKSVLEAAAILLVAYKLAWSGGILVVLVWVVAIVLIYGFITEKTTIGRHFYVVGGNREAARLSGVNTKRIMFLAYLNMAILTVVATWIVLARFQSAIAQTGNYYEMDAIGACVVGGVSAYGGSGKITGMVIGATLIGVINIGMRAMGIDEDMQKVVKGLVLLGAVAFDIISKRRSK